MIFTFYNTETLIIIIIIYIIIIIDVVVFNHIESPKQFRQITFGRLNADLRQIEITLIVFIYLINQIN